MQESSGPHWTNNPAKPFAYDQVAYPGAADPRIQLRNLEVTATMFGAQPAELSGCRVLELGCADGTNLLPFAIEFPESQFVGVDLAEDRIRLAKEVASEASAQNVQFHHASVVDLDSSLGSFDYILCPGVFSWVTDEVRQAILRVCRECLAPAGVAAVSYNALPGWNGSGTLRDFIRHCVKPTDEPAKQIADARNAVEFLAANAPANSTQATFYARARDRLRRKSDAYLYHDYITDPNRAFYFREFESLANDHRLKFFGEADFRHSSGFGLDVSGRSAVVQTPPENREQLLDFLLNTSYRSSMLCHAACHLTPRIQHERIREFELALTDPLAEFTFDPSSPQPLTLPFEKGAVTVTDVMVKASLRHLMDRWPATVRVNELYASAEDMCTAFASTDSAKHEIDGPEVLAQTMLAFYGAGLIKPFKTKPEVVDRVSNHPEATPLVRSAATRGLEIVNQWHQNVRNLSANERLLLSLLDGTRDVQTLVNLYETSAKQQPDDSVSPETFVHDRLHSFAKKLLLVA
jgi:2-polyprenyl-3-methyl-5-hydroxy-6-metoxy-1,4-benzoquinol methylase/methyltransferase-like protein